MNDVFVAIKEMHVRGAPAIGAAAAYGMALSIILLEDDTALRETLSATKEVLDSARPTAVNLSWATDKVKQYAFGISDLPVNMIKIKVLEYCHKICELDVATNHALAKHGADLFEMNSVVIHHCNTGSLATVSYGTALGVVFELHNQKKSPFVYVDETRPRLQGARLTAFELKQNNIPFKIITDSTAGYLLTLGKVDAVLVGADRVCSNGDVANKIGTYSLSVLAKENGVRFYAAVPTSTIDLALKSGKDIEIEERGAEEVLKINGVSVAPADSAVFNPAFDITPHRYITGIITEVGVCYPPYTISLSRAVNRAKLEPINGINI